MPVHDHYCGNCNETSERFVLIEDLGIPQRCHCGQVMERIYTKFPMTFVQPDYRYTSPVDGRPVTNYHEHLEELARTDSVVYEEGIKQDQERNQRVREEALDKAVDETVEREITTMPAAKREKLEAELQGGLTAEPARVTPPQRSFRDAQ